MFRFIFFFQHIFSKPEKEKVLKIRKQHLKSTSIDPREHLVTRHSQPRNMGVMSIQGDLLVLGASLRLTRLVVSDKIGQWWVKDPIDKAMDRYAERNPSVEPWWWKYRDGLDCPWCVGFWLGAGTLASYKLAKGTRAESLWRLAAGALTLNEIATHLGSRLGDYDDNEEDTE